VFRGDEQSPSAIGRFVHVYVDAAGRRPIDVPPALRAVLEPVRDETARRFAAAGVDDAGLP
jgi:acyl-CoA thioesterase FadM